LRAVFLHMSFGELSVGEVFDPVGAGVGSGVDGRYGGVFDGRYVYLSPANYHHNTHGEVMRYDTSTVEPIPALSEWGLVLMLVLVLAAGTIVLVRARLRSPTPGVGRVAEETLDVGCSKLYGTEKEGNIEMRCGRCLMGLAAGTVFANWAAFDPGEHGVGNDPDGYDGIVSDGRYVYFSPGFNGTEYHGEVLRYDTDGDFEHASSWEAYDPGAHGVGLIARGYRGPAFDGRYVYFAPFAIDESTVHGEVLRYDTSGEFSNILSWSAYNPSTHDIGFNTTGYNDAIFVGRYVYFVPLVNSTGFHGEVLRYDTVANFDSPTSWRAFDPGFNGIGSTPDGYKSAVFDGRYIYFVPSHTSVDFHGEVLRYDTDGDFELTASWTAYDPGEHEVGTDPDGFAAAVFDGRYIYFGPGLGALGVREVLRYDTAADFLTPSSWLTFDPQSEGLGTWETGFAGSVFDGRHIYFMPHVDFDISTEVALRYDTAATFTDPSSWSVFDPASADVGCGIDGHHVGVCDGRYVYFAPTNWNYPELVHGEVLRYDTGQTEPIPALSEWGFVVMLLLVLGAGTAILKGPH